MVESGLDFREDAALIELVETLRRDGYHFTTVTPLTNARVNQRPGNVWAKNLADVFGWSRPFHKDLLPVSIFELMRAADILLATDDGGFRSKVRVSTHGTQIFVHSAYPTTDANAVFFGPDTVRFVQAIIRHLQSRNEPPQRVADVGCGAGPGGIVVSATAPSADVLMLDINSIALRYARLNAVINRVTAHASHSNILTGTRGNFDLIVSNPPYLIDPGKRSYRHGGGHLGEGLSLKILQESLPRLSRGGTLLLYTGSVVVLGRDGFAEACRDQLQATQYRWSYTEIDPDVFGEELEEPAYGAADRIAAVLLTVTNESLL